MIFLAKDPELTHLLLGVCGVLALVNGTEWFYLNYSLNQSRQIVQQTVDSDVVFDQVSGHEFVLPPKDSFSEIVERPLMIQGRRPVPETSDEPIKPVPVSRGEIQIKLMGIVMTPNRTTALMQDAKGAYQNVPIAGTIDGWELDEMHADRVILTQDGLREELKLRKPKPKKPIQQQHREKPQSNRRASSKRAKAPPATFPPPGNPDRNIRLRNENAGRTPVDRGTENQERE